MIEIRKILCPTDFSEFSRRAFDHAVAVARWYESEITVLHVVPVAPIAAAAAAPVALEPIVLTPEEREQILRHINQFVSEEAPRGMVCAPQVRDGQPAEEIMRQAAAMPADLIVLGSHGRSGFERLLLGSVAEKVLRRATCPVLIVPRRAPDAVPAAAVVFKRIVCAIDFSDCSLRAVEYALSLAREADGDLTLIHVMARGFDSFPSVDVPDEEIAFAAFQQRREAAARQRLAALIPSEVPSYCQVQPVIEHGKPSDQILQHAARFQADVIVLGVQGHGAVDRALFGSTTQDVLRRATCPVLTIPGR